VDALGKDGRYELQAQIGQGPRSTVHRALDLRRCQTLILKRFAAPAASLAKYADIAARVKRAGVAAVLSPQGPVTQGPSPFALFLPVDGQPLESLVRAGAMNWARAADIVARCAAALAAVAAATGETHRALKPSNVWISPGGDPLVMDFGAAQLGAPEPVVRGPEIVEYRAPEQLDGSPGDARTDVFTLAVLLVELTTGLHPFAGSTKFQAAHKLSQTPPDLAELTRGMSPASAREVVKFTTRALAGDPARRPPDVATFVQELAYVRTLVGAPAPARAPRAEPRPLPAAPVEDPTTMMRLPNMRRLFADRQAPPQPAPPPAAAPPPEPTAPDSHPAPRPAPSVAPIALSPLPEVHRPAPVPADRTEQLPIPTARAGRTGRPSHQPVPADRTEQLPIPPARAGRTEPSPSPVPADRTEQRPVAPVPADRTVPLAAPTRARAPEDRTMRDIRPHVDDEATHVLPLISRPRAPASALDEPTTVTPARPHAAPDGPPDASPALDAPAPEPPPAPQPAAKRVQWILIAINVLCAVLLLVGLALSVLT
jgi:serine/threonine protein kinase